MNYKCYQLIVSDIFFLGRKRRRIRWQQDFATWPRCLKLNGTVIHRIIYFFRMNLKKLETASVFFQEQKTHRNLGINSTIYKHYAVNLPHLISCLTALTKRMNGWMNKRKLSHPLLADQCEFKNIALTLNNYDSVTFLEGANGLHSTYSDQIATWQKTIHDSDISVGSSRRVTQNKTCLQMSSALTYLYS